ncbi:MAG: hypothetical protein JOY86_02850 [Candidatus Eremiobacteraeota bacterium]|nr:hypothetical protein [Candidatus Eremiobacteraeota bacterium]
MKAAFPGLLLAAVLLHIGYIAAGGQPGAHPLLVLLGLAAYALAFVAVAGAFSTRPAWAAYILPGMCIAAYVLWSGIGHLTSQTVVNPAFEQYQTDSLEFSAYSAQLLLQHEDPYTASMAPAAQRFRISPRINTPTMDGDRVSVQPYPALSFLVYVPFVLAHVQSMIWVDIGFQLVAMLLVLALAPVWARTLFGLFFLVIPEYREFAVGSVTDVVWLPLMIGVAASWDRRPALAATLLGFACAIKQEPWFVVPFALIHWWQLDETPAKSTAWRNLGLLAGAFLLPNFPFLIWHPAAWLAGVFSPVLSHPVPLGSGLIQLQTSGFTALPLGFYTVLWVGTLALCAAAYALWPNRLAWLPFIAPALVLFFSPRSLQNYFVYWPVVLAMYAATAPQQRVGVPQEALPSLRARAAGIAAGIAIVLLAAVGAGAAGQQVAIAAGRVALDPQTGYVRGIDVRLNNPTARPLAFRFAVCARDNAMVFWRTDQSLVPAHDTAILHLRANDIAREIPAGDGFQVVAFAPQDSLAVYTRPLRPADARGRGLRNGRLISAVNAFEMLPVQAPLAWTADPRAFLDGRLAVVHDGPFGNALRFRLGAQARRAPLSQTFVPSGRRFAFWIKPVPRGLHSSRAGALRVTFVDASGREICCNAPPARDGVWNRYDVEMPRAAVTSANSITIVVGPDDRVLHGALNAEFGGIVEYE